MSDIAVFVLKRDIKLQPTNPGYPGKEAIKRVCMSVGLVLYCD